MADKAEKDLDQASDCGWIRGLDASGNPIKLNKADMVELIRANMQVVTPNKNGLMGFDNLRAFNYGVVNVPLNSSRSIGRISGLLIIQAITENAEPAMFLVSTFAKSVIKIAGFNLSIQLSVDTNSELVLTNPPNFIYGQDIYYAFQQVGVLAQ